jgi:hypothetical protein
MPNSRRKGANYELEVGKKLRAWATPELLRLGLKPSDWFVRAPLSGGWNRTHANGEDLLLPQSSSISIECKKREAWTFSALLRGVATKTQVWGFWDEAVARIPADKLLVLIFSQNREDDWVLMPLSLWVALKLGDSTADLTIVPRLGIDFVLMTLTNFMKAACPKRFLSESL